MAPTRSPRAAAASPSARIERSLRPSRSAPCASSDQAAAYLLNGFNVAGFAAALIGSLIYSLCGMVIDVAVERVFSRDATA